MKCSKSLLQQSQPSGEASLKKEGYIQVVAQQMEIGPGISQSFLQTNPKETSKLPYYTNQIIQRQWLEIVDTHTHKLQMGVSKNRGTPWYHQIIHFNRVFHYFHHPFWGFSPYFWKHPNYKKTSTSNHCCAILFAVGEV